MNTYRTRVYECYVSRGGRALPPFAAAAAAHWGRAYDLYLRGWLPAHPDAAVADVACGGGGLLYFFRSRGFSNLAGVDVSAEQVRVARRVVPGVVNGDVFDFLAARPGALDLIAALDLVEHLHKDEVLRFLAACREALRPGGRPVLRTPNADGPFVLEIRYGDFTHEVCFNPHSPGRLLNLSGFARLEARECGPRPRGLRSAGRWLLWRLIRLGIRAWNLAETGHPGGGVYTRVFLMSGVKP